MENGALLGVRPAGNTYEIKDDGNVLSFFLDHKDDTPNALCHSVLSNQNFWGEDLTQLPGLEEKVSAFLSCILEKGAYCAMQQVL